MKVLRSDCDPSLGVTEFMGLSGGNRMFFHLKPTRKPRDVAEHLLGSCDDESNIPVDQELSGGTVALISCLTPTLPLITCHGG